jgi:hypothetical protein
MPRGAPSRADVDLMVELEKLGVFVSPYQLERWRLAGYLPKPVRRGLGRGPGSTSRYPDEALPMAVVLACKTGQRRSTKAAVLELFMEGFPFQEKAVRAALLWVLDRAERERKRVRRQGTAAITKAVDRSRASVTAYHPLLVTFNPEKQQPRRVLRQRAAHRRELKDAVAMSVDAAIHNETPPADSVLNWLRLAGMPGVAENILIAEESKAGTSSRALTPARRLARTIPFSQLCAARWVANGWGGITLFLMLGLSGGNQLAEEVLEQLSTNEAATWLTWSVGVPVNPDQIASAILSLAASEVHLKMGWEFVKNLMPVAIAVMANTMHELDFDERLIWPMMRMSEIGPDAYGDLPLDELSVNLEALERMAGNALTGAEAPRVPDPSSLPLPATGRRTIDQ